MAETTTETADRRPKLEPVRQGKRVIEEPIDNGKYESAFLPEILEAAKKNVAPGLVCPACHLGG